jgi:predicted dehydrogenase
VARYAGGRSGRIELVGETGQLMGDFDHGYAMLIRGRRATPLDLAPPAHTVISALKAFVQALRYDEEPPISAVDGYRAVEIAEACYESASAKEPVEIEADDDDTPEDWDEC